MLPRRWIIEVEHPLRGWIRVGAPFRTKRLAQGWVRFVRAAWRICDVRVVLWDTPADALDRAAKGGA